MERPTRTADDAPRRAAHKQHAKLGGSPAQPPLLMSFIEKIKAKFTAKKGPRIRKSSTPHQPRNAEEDGPTFHTLPHPAVGISIRVSKSMRVTCAS